MTFLAPIYLAIAAAAAVGILALHLITRDRPPRAPLPTARFVPARVEHAMSRATRPADPLLLVVRMLVVLLAGTAFARPVLEPNRRAVARVIVLDGSRAVADPGEARDSVLTLLAEGDALVVLDSLARVVAGSPRDSLVSLEVPSPAARPAAPRGSLSAALLAARRAAQPLLDRADSIELVLVSPVAAEQLDAATGAIRAQWRGRVRLVPVAAATQPGPEAVLDVRASMDDPIGAAAALLGAGYRTTQRARVTRELPSARDSAFAREGGVLVVWPREASLPGWSERAIVDTVGAVVADDVVLVAPFERRWVAPPGFRVAARWVDGGPAAIERTLGGACVREVAVPLDEVGDIALRAETRRLLAALAEPCGGRRQLEPVEDAVRTRLAGDGPLALARELAADQTRPSPLVPWLLGAALLVALAEPLVRRGGSA